MPAYLAAAGVFLAAAVALIAACLVTQTPVLGTAAGGLSVLAGLAVFASARARTSRS